MCQSTTKPLLTPQLAVELLKELGTNERHFNGLQAQYRAMASAWLLAAFGGTGFLLEKRPALIVPNEAAIFMIALATSIGIMLLWILDLLVYHRLLAACFEEACRLEDEHSFLPSVRCSMRKSQPGGTATTRVRLFYVFLSVAPMVFAGPFFIHWGFKDCGWTTGLATIALVFAIPCLIGGTIWRHSLSISEEPKACEVDSLQDLV